jgi:hypothetical protein
MARHDYRVNGRWAKRPTSPFGVPKDTAGSAARAHADSLKKESEHIVKKTGSWKGKLGLAAVGLGLAAMYGVGSAIQASVAQVRTQNRNWDRQ